MRFIFLLLFLAGLAFSQTYVTVPDKSTGNSLTAAEFNQVLDAIKDGTLSINTTSLTVGGTNYTVFMLPSAMRDSIYAYLTDSIGVSVQGYDAQLADLADGTLSGDFINTANPWGLTEIVSTVIAEGENATLLDGTNWRILYINGSGDVTELALGTNGQVLKSTGASSIPEWATDNTGSGGSAYADSVVIDSRHVPGDSLVTEDEVAATYEIQLNNEAGIYAVLSDVSDFVQPAELVGANETYASGWNADTGIPEKDDIYDYLHQIDSDDDGNIGDETITITNTWTLGTGGSISGLGDITGLDTLDAAQVVVDTITITDWLVYGSAVISEAEMEILDGATLTTTEINYVDGVTSAIQDQIDAIGTPATADISDVSVTQTELAELETIGVTTISAAQWTGLGGATTAGIALWDDAAASNQLVTLGLNATASEINSPLDGASVTLTEFQELEAIDATTISAGQWADLGGDGFLLNDGDTGTGVYDFGGATTFEIPNAANPTTAGAGIIAHDTDDEFLEFGANSRVVGALQVKTFVIYNPDSVGSDVCLFHFMADVYPHGVTMKDIAVSTSATSTDAVTLEEWDDRAGSTQSTIETITLSSQYTEDDGTLSDAALAADSFLNLLTSSFDDDIQQIEVTITFWINAGD